MNYPADPLELQVERLLRSCAILPMLKGFYPLRDLTLLYVRGEVPADVPTRKAAAALTSRYGRRCREAMCRALAHGWRAGSRLTQLTARGPLDKPPGVEEFVLAICRELKAPA